MALNDFKQTIHTALAKPVTVDAWSMLLNTEPTVISDAIKADNKVLDLSTYDASNPYRLDQPKKSQTAKKAWKLKQEKLVNLINPNDVSFWPDWREEPAEGAVGDEKPSSIEVYRRFVWDCFEKPEKSHVSNLINLYVLVLILVGALISVIETIPGLHKQNPADDIFYAIEIFFVVNFTVELAIRTSTCPDLVAFWSSSMNWIDLISIVPFYLELILGGLGINLQVLRVLRTGRALRMVKLGRYSSGIRLIQNSLAASYDALQLFAFIFMMLVVVLSSALYYTERGEYNEATGLYMREDSITEQITVSPFQSIPMCFWWCIVTLVTVGYGDVYPVTPGGYTVGIVTQMLGVVMLALPLSIIGSNFHEEREKMNEDIALEQMPLIDDRGWLEAAEAAVDGGESAFESLEVLSISMAECLCSILELSYSTNTIGGTTPAAAGSPGPKQGEAVPGAVNASPGVGGEGDFGSPPAKPGYVKVNSETMEMLAVKVNNMLGIVQEMHAELKETEVDSPSSPKGSQGMVAAGQLPHSPDR